MRRCGLCSGKVYLVSQKTTIEHPARDERGRFIYEQRFDKESGQMVERQVMVSWPIRGLGTWHCENCCKDRIVKVKRFTGAGKEEDQKKHDDFCIDVPVTRHIPVRAA